MIVVDTREQYPLWTTNVIRKKLNAGDYSIEGYEDKIAIERKSGADLLATLSKGHERFKREIERGLKLDYFAIVIEEPLQSVYYNMHIGGEHTQMKGSTALKILITISMKYKVPFFFCHSRAEAMILIENILKQYVNNKEKVYK